MTPKFKTGDRVRFRNRSAHFEGSIGTVIQIVDTPIGYPVYTIRYLNPSITSYENIMTILECDIYADDEISQLLYDKNNGTFMEFHFFGTGICPDLSNYGTNPDTNLGICGLAKPPKWVYID